MSRGSWCVWWLFTTTVTNKFGPLSMYLMCVTWRRYCCCVSTKVQWFSSSFKCAHNVDSFTDLYVALYVWTHQIGVRKSVILHSQSWHESQQCVGHRSVNLTSYLNTKVSSNAELQKFWTPITVSRISLVLQFKKIRRFWHNSSLFLAIDAIECSTIAFCRCNIFLINTNYLFICLRDCFWNIKNPNYELQFIVF